MTRTGMRERLAVALGVVAVVAVIGASATTAGSYLRRDREASPAGHARPSPGGSSGGPVLVRGQLVESGRGARVRFEVPARADGWTLHPADTVLYYVDRSGRPAVGVEGAAVFREGYCGREDDSNRAFVGFTRPVAATSVVEAARVLGRAWVAAIALDDDLRTLSPHTPLRTEEVTLADGTAAVRSTSRITVADRGPCDAPAVEFAMVSLDAGGSVSSVVLVRDAGAPGTLAGAVADEILATVRVRD